jgi:type IV pilus assembly protein PilX
MKTQRPFNRPPQDGIALIVVLIMIVLVTLLGIAAVRTLTLQERMASNQFDRNLAMQSAERTLRLAEGIAFTQSLAVPNQNPDFQPPQGPNTGVLNGNYSGQCLSGRGTATDPSPCGTSGNGLGLCSQPTPNCAPRWMDPAFDGSWKTVISTTPASASSSAVDADSNLSAGLQQQ